MSLSIKQSIQNQIDSHICGLREGIDLRIRRLRQKPNDSYVKRQLKNWRSELETLQNGGIDAHIALVEKDLLTDAEAKRVDIICLKYKEEDIEKKCVSNLVDGTDWPYKLTWYDSRNQSANFSKLWNHLTEISTCEYIVIMDSDAYVSAHWLSKMMQSFNDAFTCTQHLGSDRMVHPQNVGLVVPITREGAASTVQGRIADADNIPPFLANSEQVSGFFFLFKKAMWEDIGPFDERFYLHGQDSEWVDRVIASKWDIVVRPDVFVDHEVSAAISKASKNKEFNYDIDILYTRMIYDLIRSEKSQGIYAPFRY